MSFGKKASKSNILLWIGVGMIGTALILALVGIFYGSQAGNYYAPPGNAGSSGVPRSLTEAREAFEQAVSNSYGDSNLEVVDVMEFANNFYAEVEENDAGIHAMELLIDKRSGRVHPEPGPNMMWNTKYGMMGDNGMGSQGMMGPGGQGMMGQVDKT